MNPRQINVLVFGASGMVGTAVLRECLADTQVAQAATIGRTAPTSHSGKLTHITHIDLLDYSAIGFSLTRWCG